MAKSKPKQGIEEIAQAKWGYGAVEANRIKVWCRARGVTDPLDAAKLWANKARRSNRPEGKVRARRIMAWIIEQEGGEAKPEIDTVMAAERAVDKFEEQPAEGNRDLNDDIRELTAWTNRAEQRCQHYSKVNDETRFGEWSDLRLKFSRALTNALTTKKRLDIESGEVIGRKECERILKAIAFLIGVGIEEVRVDMCEKVSGLTDTAIAYKALESPMLSKLLLYPFRHAMDVSSGIGIPEWVANVMIEGVEDIMLGEPISSLPVCDCCRHVLARDTIEVSIPPNI